MYAHNDYNLNKQAVLGKKNPVIGHQAPMQMVKHDSESEEEPNARFAR